MSWQDIVFTGGQFIFVLALIPSIRSKDKPAFYTSLVTSIILATFGLTYMNLHLWGSAVMALANSASWGILAFQKYRIDKNGK